MKIVYLLLFAFSNIIILEAQTGILSDPTSNGGASFNPLPDSAYEIWSARYDGPGNDWDEGLAITVDGLGNIYVTGGSPPAPGTAFDYATIKYSSSGNQEWVARYTGTPTGVDEAFAIAVDNDGNVYVTGYSDGGASSNDYATIKYNSDGVQQWAARYDGPANDDDAATAIAVDNLGNVYVTGYSRSTLINYDFATVKYNSSGDLVWAARYNGTGNSFDQANDVAVDAQGNVFVTGWSLGTSGFYDYTTIKYNSGGEQQWVSRYTGTGLGDNICAAMAVDDMDNVYITGGSTGENGVFDYVTVKYNSSGVQQWASRYDGPVNDYDQAKDIKVDASGNVYVTGKSVGLNTWLDFATVKYNTSGSQEWVARYDGPLNIDDEVSAIALDNYGNVYITGVCVGVTSDYDYVTIKYNSMGEDLWMMWFNGPGNMGDRPYGIAVDATGYVYITGYSYDTSYDYATVKYGQTPVPVELTSFNAVTDDRDVILSWTTSSEVNNWGFEVERKMCGQWETIGFKEGFGTTTEPESYSYTDKNVIEGKYFYRLKQVDFNGSYKYSYEIEVKVELNEFSLSQNYPNPFNPSTLIKYSIPEDGFVSLKVYNTLGQEVAELVNGLVKAGGHEVTFNVENLSSGIYYYRMESGDNVSVRKMMILK